MMKYSYFLFFLFFILSSCEEKITIETDKDFQPAIVINSFFGVNSDTVKVYITNTVPTYSNSEGEFDLEYVYLKNILTGQNVELVDFGNLWITNLVEIKENDVYEISIKQKGTSIVQSVKDTVPRFVDILDVNYYYFSETERPAVGVNLSFSSISDSKSVFYELLVYEAYYHEFINPENKFRQTTLKSQDSRITSEDYYPSLMFFAADTPKSLFFSTSSDTIDLNFTYNNIAVFNGISSWIPKNQIKIKLRRVSYAYYKYKTSLYKQQLDVKGDILFGLPSLANVYSNVENGYGIFGCYNSTDTIIDIEEYIVNK